MAQRGKIDKSRGFVKERNNHIDNGQRREEKAKTVQLKKKVYDSYLSNNENEGTYCIC